MYSGPNGTQRTKDGETENKITNSNNEESGQGDTEGMDIETEKKRADYTDTSAIVPRRSGESVPLFER